MCKSVFLPNTDLWVYTIFHIEKSEKLWYLIVTKKNPLKKDSFLNGTEPKTYWQKIHANRISRKQKTKAKQKVNRQVTKGSHFKDQSSKGKDPKNEKPKITSQNHLLEAMKIVKENETGYAKEIVFKITAKEQWQSKNENPEITGQKVYRKQKMDQQRIISKRNIRF